MAIRNRLKHVAAGLLGSFCSRCNGLEGYWALGMLYEEVQQAPYCVTLDLLTRTALPAGCHAGQIAANYAVFLERALSKQHLRREDLAEATVKVQFKADVPLREQRPDWLGDPFICAVTLRRADDVAFFSAHGQCMPNDPRLFRQGGHRSA